MIGKTNGPGRLWPAFSARVEGGEVAWQTCGHGFSSENGDFCDLIRLGERSAVAVCGDVSGYGRQVAADARDVRDAFREIARRRVALAPSIASLNDRLIRLWADRPRSMFATAAFVRVQPEASGLHALGASAGHPLPLILRADGTLSFLGQPGQLLGVFHDPVVPLSHTVLYPGDALILYTDGIVDGLDLHDGTPSLAELVRGCAGASPRDIGDCVMLALAEATTDRMDDRAVLVIRADDHGGKRRRRDRRDSETVLAMTESATPILAGAPASSAMATHQQRQPDSIHASPAPQP